MTMAVQPHFLLLTYPAQGHINPALQFAKGLTRIGVLVTLVTSLSAGRRVSTTLFPDGLSFVTFSDGYDDGFKPEDDRDHFTSELKRRGSQTLNELIVDSAKEGKPVTCLVYTMLLHWAAEQHFFGSSLQLSLTSITITSMVMVISSIIARTLRMLLSYQGSHHLLAVTFPRLYFLQILMLLHSRCFKSSWSSSAKKPTQKCLSTLSMHWNW
jgi:UDP:flavonoid glycosyltransferase YjiC (YdhE family)